MNKDKNNIPLNVRRLAQLIVYGTATCFPFIPPASDDVTFDEDNNENIIEVEGEEKPYVNDEKENRITCAPSEGDN